MFGFKPTDRRVSTTGMIPEVPGMPKSIRQMMTVGPLARSIEDLRLCFSLIAGAAPQQPDIPPVPLDTPSQKSLQNLRIAWTDELSTFPVAIEIKSALVSVAKKLADVGMQIEQWIPDFDFVAACQIYFAVATYNMIYSQQIAFDDVRKQLPFLFREATPCERRLRNLINTARTGLSIWLNPSLKGYFEALTERDRLIAQMDKELE